MPKSKKKTPATEMIRLPADVVLALRQRGATAGVTLGEAARQLMLAHDLGRQHGTIEHASWLRARLVDERQEIESVLELGDRDAAVVAKAISGLTDLLDDWARVGDEEHQTLMRFFMSSGMP